MAISGPSDADKEPVSEQQELLNVFCKCSIAGFLLRHQSFKDSSSLLNHEFILLWCRYVQGGRQPFTLLPSLLLGTKAKSRCWWALVTDQSFPKAQSQGGKSFSVLLLLNSRALQALIPLSSVQQSVILSLCKCLQHCGYCD